VASKPLITNPKDGAEGSGKCFLGKDEVRSGPT
jgi:hypothetical protein